MTILKRFKGIDGKRKLTDQMLRQSIVQGDVGIAEGLCKAGKVLEIRKNQDLIVQGHSDSDIYFILSGSFDIFINGRRKARRSSGHHVGEMAMIDSSSSRSATVRSRGDSIVLKVDETSFTALANRFPIMWRLIARDLSFRLRQRSRFIKLPNLKPHVFIGCSSESLASGEMLRKYLSTSGFTITLWTDGIFQLSTSALQSLYRAAQTMDFAVLLLGPDDKLKVRDNFFSSPRDNLVFELGLFMGALSPARTIFVAPAMRHFKIPSDLDGITYVQVKLARNNKSIPETEVKKASKKIQTHISKLGVK